MYPTVHYIYHSVSAKLCILVTFTSSRACGQCFCNTRLISKENDRRWTMSDRKSKPMDRKWRLWCTLRHKQQPLLFVMSGDLLHCADLTYRSQCNLGWGESLFSRAKRGYGCTGSKRFCPWSYPWQRGWFPVFNVVKLSDGKLSQDR